MSVSLESALTLSLLASCGTYTPVPSVHSCNLHPPLCLECFTLNQLPHSPTSRSHAEKNASHPLTSSTHELWLSYNVIKTNIPVYISRYKAYSIHYTVKSEFCARKTTQSFHEHCSLRKKNMWKYCSCHLVWTFYMCYTQTVLSQICLTQISPGFSARQHMYRFRGLWVLPFPLKVDTNNKQLALVKWNNVFFFSIQFIQK